MNILFVNYGDFTTNSLNHIGGFANQLSARGHACVVAVPDGRDTIKAIPDPLFIAATYAEVLERPALFPDGRTADILHAWTPREGVRKFVLAHQRLAPATRLIVHLEDNEEFLVAAAMGEPIEKLRTLSDEAFPHALVDGLPHPVRYRNLLRLADGVTVIIDALREFVPAGVPVAPLLPGVDSALYHPQPPDLALRQELGLRSEEKVIVFTGSNTFANEPEMRELYIAVKLLRQRGTPVRLVRTGFDPARFQQQLPSDWRDWSLALGFVEKAKLPKLLALADVLVQPGRAGPYNDYRLPSKVPEFLAAGRPVVLPATNIARLLRDGVDALLLHNGSPEEIATACERVLANPTLAKTLAENGAAFARTHFDLKANAKGLAEFYIHISGTAARTDWHQLGGSAAADVSLLAGTLARQVTAPAPDLADAAALAEDLAQLTRELEVAAIGGAGPLEALRARLEAERDDWRRHYELTRNHVENREKTLASFEKSYNETKTHADNLTRELTDTRARLKTAEAKYATSEKFLASTRRQIEALDSQLGAAQLNIAEHEKSARLTAEHLANIERSREELRQRIQELDTQCAHLTATIGDRDGVVQRRDEKIRAMQRSFSWRATSPLRALRRALLDPRPAPPLSDRIQANIDYPTNWNHIAPTLNLRGWALHKDGRPLTAMRARLGSRVVAGEFGMERLDVLDHFRTHPHAENCGWVVKVDVPALLAQPLVLEVQDDTGAWHAFFTRRVRRTAKAAPPPPNSYEAWVAAYDTLTPEVANNIRARLAKLTRRPLISVLMPTYNTPEKWLVRAIESVRRQLYENWELCIADDASTQPQVRRVLERFQKADRRIKVVFRETNGHISAASNSALAVAHGDFVALFDHDDELRPHALACVALELDRHPDADLVYSDEDKIDENGHRYDHYFKPDWNPDLFLVQNFVSHLGVYRTLLVREVGGFRVGYEGSQDWDLAMRVVERTEPVRIRHIPKILYHWRSVPGSTAMLMSAKSYAVTAAEKVITEHFERIGVQARITPTKGHYWRVHFPLPVPAPRVTLIIPTRNRLNVLKPGIESLLAKTAYPHFEILIIDNDSDDPATLAWLAEIQQPATATSSTVSLTQAAAAEHASGTTDTTAVAEPTVAPRPRAPVRVVRYPGEFNYSAINNFGVSQTDAPVVGLLNNDLEVIHDDWLDEMVSHALRGEIGCVGAKLYYPTDRIQHAGVILGIGGVAAHAWQTHLRGTHGQAHRAILQQNLSAVTAACLVVRREVFLEVGGFDEKLGVAFNDVDFCLSVRAAGYRNFWTPFAELYHHESASRGAEDTLEKRDRFRREVEYIQAKWGDALLNDPAYNPNLTLTINDFTLATPPREVGHWAE